MDDKPPQREQRGLILELQGLLEVVFGSNSLLYRLTRCPVRCDIQDAKLCCRFVTTAPRPRPASQHITKTHMDRDSIRTISSTVRSNPEPFLARTFAAFETIIKPLALQSGQHASN